jgi:RNA polymerase sigma factor (sigma-70 family)
MSWGELDDARLVELYLRHRGLMWRTAQRVLEGAAVGGVSADDVLQQVVLELKERGLPPDRTAPSQEQAYVLRCVRSRAIDAIRKAKRCEPLDLETFDPVDLAAVDPLLAAEQTSLLQRCDELAGHLTTNERIAFEERVKRQQPAKDVASMLDVSPSRVAQLVSAALRKLRAGLEEDGHAA